MKTILITGCSTGIGRATALRFAGKGYRTFAGVRKESDAESLTSADTSGNLEPVFVDVTDEQQIRALAQHLESAVGEQGLNGLVNNAGYGEGAPLEFLDPAVARRVMDINVIGPLLVTQAVLPLIRKARGRIVTIGSIGGKVVSPINGIYSMSKHAIEAFNDALRMELAPHGVSVSLIEPGPISTPMLNGVPAMVEEVSKTLPPEARELYGDQIESTARYFRKMGERAEPPDAVAEVIEHAMESPRPKTRYLVTTDAKSAAFMRWLLPDRLFDRAVAMMA